jgi:hypothetical protein
MAVVSASRSNGSQKVARNSPPLRVPFEQNLATEASPEGLRSRTLRERCRPTPRGRSFLPGRIGRLPDVGRFPASSSAAPCASRSRNLSKSRCRCWRRAASMRLLAAGMAILLATLSPALPFEDLQFCVAAQQLAVAADKDVGIWIDRVTRNAGMSVACDSKLVEFTRFAYIGSPAMTADWKAARSSEWNAAHCNSLLWKEAIDNGWAVVLNVATADGGRATFKAQCR